MKLRTTIDKIEDGIVHYTVENRMGYIWFYGYKGVAPLEDFIEFHIVEGNQIIED